MIDQLVDIVNPLGKIGHILPITKQFNTRPLFVCIAALPRSDLWYFVSHLIFSGEAGSFVF